MTSFSLSRTHRISIAKSHGFVPTQEMAVRDVATSRSPRSFCSTCQDAVVGEGLQRSRAWPWRRARELPVHPLHHIAQEKGNKQFSHSDRGVIMATCTFAQDAAILRVLSGESRVQLAAEKLDHIFPAG